jgi:hypothetical protein
MSAKITQIIEVISEVRDKFQGRKGNLSANIEQMRIDACKEVALQRGIKNLTVLDKCRRQLSPEIKGTSKFDALLKDWLLKDSAELQNILLKHADHGTDKELIRKTFDKVPELAKKLSAEPNELKSTPAKEYINKSGQEPIKESYNKASEEDILLAEEFGLVTNDPEFMEGKEKIKIHKIKERNRNLVKSAKEHWLINRTVICEICSFSFDKTYGEIGKDYIEAHHKLPFSDLKSDTIIKIGDLAPLCSNCHSIIHRSRPCLTIEQLKDIVEKNGHELERKNE